MDSDWLEKRILPLVPEKKQVAAFVLYPLLILVCAQLFLTLGTVPETPKHEISIKGENVTSIDSIDVEVGFAASESTNSINGLWNTGYAMYFISINGIEFDNGNGTLQVATYKEYSEGTAQFRRFYSYGYGCTLEKEERPFAQKDRIIVSNKTESFADSQAQSCGVRLRYLPKGSLYPHGRSILNISTLSKKTNKSVLRITSSQAYSCSRSSCVAPDYRQYENDGASLRVYDELSHGFVPGEVSTTVEDSRGRSIYVDLIYEPGNTQRMLQNVMLIVMTISVERLLNAIYSYGKELLADSEEESESEFVKGPAS